MVQEYHNAVDSEAVDTQSNHWQTCPFARQYVSQSRAILWRHTVPVYFAVVATAEEVRMTAPAPLLPVVDSLLFQDNPCFQDSCSQDASQGVFNLTCCDAIETYCLEELDTDPACRSMPRL